MAEVLDVEAEFWFWLRDLGLCEAGLGLLFFCAFWGLVLLMVGVGDCRGGGFRRRRA